MFHSKDGEIIKWLLSLGASTTIWENISQSKDVLLNISSQKHLLVHNTFMSKDDLMDVYYCTCPKANIYIEGTTPDYSFFNLEKLCVGTDSLASNSSLSIIEELFCIQENSDFDLNSLLKIGSKNGADCLGFTSLGTFENGKVPGINLLQNIDFNMKITTETTVKRII
jgi:cytosine/adenosine deaminase-related metal-dependent hydrolase